jgi:hypothetical protein
MSRILIHPFPVILLQILFLVGCAIGGDGKVNTNAATNPERLNKDGLYIGIMSNGYIHNTFLLENGQYYVLYGVSTTPALKVAGFVQGSGTLNDGIFSSKDLKDFFWDGSVFNGSLSASYSSNTFNGTITKANSTIALAGEPPAVAYFNYNEAPNILAIAGDWKLTSMAGASTTMSINSNGTFTGNTGRCTYAGTLAPHSSGKNVFEALLTFGGSPCSLPGQSVSGAAISYLLADGVTRQFILVGVNADRSVGTAVFGTRSTQG